MSKKATFTCKICGGEHSGLICTKFVKLGNGGLALLDQPQQRAQNAEMRALLTHVAAQAGVIDVEAETVTSVTKPVGKKPAGNRRVTKPSKVKSKGGRPKTYASAAERTAAYRARKKQGMVT